MNKLETFKIWAPDTVPWTEWAKPILFTNVPPTSTELYIPHLLWPIEIYTNTAIIIDLPGKQSVEEGLAMARIGYRPVPLYNGVYRSRMNTMLVDVDDVVKAIFAAPNILLESPIRMDAPPVFLLDSNRMNGDFTLPEHFDNRWCVFPQDMPSASFLKKRGIHQVVIRSDQIRVDLSHILCRYQEQGIKIYVYNFAGPPMDIIVTKPSRYKSLFYRFAVSVGLRRNSAGGFGGVIPDPYESRSGHGSRYRYRGIG